MWHGWFASSKSDLKPEGWTEFIVIGRADEEPRLVYIDRNEVVASQRLRIPY